MDDKNSGGHRTLGDDIKEGERLIEQRMGREEAIRGESKPEKTPGWVTAAIIAGIALIVYITDFRSGGGNKSSPPPPQDIHLNASISFDETQFVIKNNNDFDWTNVKLEINSGLIRSGYYITVPLIEGFRTYTVGALQFAKSDGTRFNPFFMKPRGIFISASTSRGRGFYSGNFRD